VELDPVECRVLGSLIEKEHATPQNYPLTLNALRHACNQSTNRDPVVDYDDRTIEVALTSLREKGLSRIVYSTSNRAAKFRHVLGEALHLIDEELAVLAILLLRGPQTVGEIKGRTDRLTTFESLDDVQAMLDRLAAREAGALVLRLERRPGQKDVRWAHLLAGEPDQTTPEPAPSYRAVPGGSYPSGGSPGAAPAPAAGALAAIVAEVEALRAELDELRAEHDEMKQAFEAFRAEFS
jgi:uncharacterized protein YceH (UPF0502 family)